MNNQTFTEWFVDDYLFGENGGANPNVSGFFFDDQYLVAGATESSGNGVQLGLNPAQMTELSRGYWGYMSTVYAQVVERGAFAWQQLWTGQGKSTADLRAGSYPSGMSDAFQYLAGTGVRPLITKGDCAGQLRKLCSSSSDAQTRAALFAFQGPPGSRHANPSNLTYWREDLTAFLLARGPYS